MQYVIGIDIGTGSTKAVAINYTGEVIASSQFYYPLIDTLPGHSEQNPELIWEAFINAVKETISKLKNMPAAVSLSSCMHSLMVVGKDDKPLTNLITWADTRSESVAEEIRNSADAEEIYRSTGTPIHSMSPLCKIIWFRKHAAEIFENAYKFISIKEFIWFRLFGVYQIDYSIASATGMFNIHDLEWNKTSLLLCEINANKLSAIVSTQYIRKDLTAEIASSLNLSEETPFCIGASDGCLANAGSNAVSAGIAAVTIGTSGAVRIANSVPVFNYESMTFNYILDDENFICGGPVNNGGNVLKWLFKSFLNNNDPSKKEYENLFELIESVSPGANGLIFLPYLHGERAPVWDEKTCGVFFGIKEHHFNKQFFRAALEGICFSLKNILQIVESSANPITQINVSGGFIHSKTWIQLLADITGKRICVIKTDDASAIGAAIFYLKASKSIDSYSLRTSDSLFIEPGANNHEVYKEYYNIFKNLYQPLKQSMHQLHQLNS